MAADVGSLLRAMGTAPITQDLLGGGLEATELDLDMEVPDGWEKSLDLKTGKLSLKKKPQPKGSSPRLQDLNFPPSSKPTLSLFNESSLDLNLALSRPPMPSSLPNHESAHTHVEKVKSALERAEREASKKRSAAFSKSLSPVLSNSSSLSVREMEMEKAYEVKSSSSFATGCPNCLLYVLVSSNDPKCPRCSVVVPAPVAVKKPRIDLNFSM